MSLATIFSLAVPTLALLGILAVNPAEDTFLSGGYYAWFLVGSALVVTSAILLLRRSPRTWKNGSILLWLSAACFMGAYWNVHVDGGRVDALRRAATKLVKNAGDTGAAETWKTRGGEPRTADASAVTRLEEDLSAVTAIEYLLSVTFVATFYMIGVYAAPKRQREYHVLREEVEDPLAFKEIYGIS
ncbi:MAG: hypothetical protein H6832_05515 [Planctomycetes bacterium]|nr:hypothetical protein [Planctomycetota bacterium]MCB9917841.1 hypothetical protein [Planctomycetota bacterium]